MIWLGLLLSLLLGLYALSYFGAARRAAVAPPPQPATPVEAGACVLLLHRREAGREEVDNAWTPARRTRVRAAAAATGLRSHLVIRHVPRINIIYVLLRLSRSWPFAALNALRHGFAVQAPRRAQAEEDYDLAELFYFDDLAAARRFLGGEAVALAREAGPVMRRTEISLMRATRALSGVEQSGRVANFYMLRAREEVGRDGMIDYWLHRHRPYVLGLQPVLGYSAYDQLVAPGAGGDWDGAALLTYRDFPDLARGLIDPRIQMANFGLVHDEARFLDFARSSLMLGVVTSRWPAAKEDDGT